MPLMLRIVYVLPARRTSPERPQSPARRAPAFEHHNIFEVVKGHRVITAVAAVAVRVRACACVCVGVWVC